MHFERLSKHHDKKLFDCGNADINQYLWQYANQHDKKGIAKTHVLVENSTIIGFYTLSNIHLDNTDFAIKSNPRQIPAILIGRMGVDKTFQGQGIAKLLLSHALKKVHQLAEDTGISLVVIDAKDEKLVKYYQNFGFSVLSDLRLVLAVATIKP